MTPQEIFDIAARHMLLQGKRAETEGGICLYRARDGSRCPVGWLIPDDLYTRDLEGHNALGPKVESVLQSAGVLSRDDACDDNWDDDWGPARTILIGLQSIHDNWEPHDWRNGLISLANRCKLDPTVAEETKRGKKHS